MYTLGLFSLFAIFPAIVLAEYGSIDISKPTVMKALNTAASLTKVYLDTMGPFHHAGTDSASWHYDGSYVQLPTGKKISFKLPRKTWTGVLRRYELYIESVASEKIEFSREGSLWKLHLSAQDDSKAIVVGCIKRKKDKPCYLNIIDKSAAIRNFYIDFYFTLEFSGAKATLKPHHVDVDLEYMLNSIVLQWADHIVSFIIDVKSTLTDILENAIMTAMASQEVETHLSKDLNSLIFDRIQNFLPDFLQDPIDFIQDKVRINGIQELSTVFRITFEYPAISKPTLPVFIRQPTI